jgi:1-deoxy-D-xylulose-5-phosphate reductoisomerase
VDLVVNGVVGAAGLEASLRALETGKLLALANKESMVLAGELLSAAASRGGGRILPVDSEHSGLFQCLDGRESSEVSRLIITASGGPFRGRSRESLAGVTPQEALAHPVWPMGRRITVDSATLMNKGLEVIETHRLFHVPLDRIEVWVHPQSVVHALVEWVDGSLLAQMSAPDMLLPVQYAMSYPERWPAESTACRLPDWKDLRFEMPDHDTFPALRLAIRAAELGGTAPSVLNAADEVAVEAFLEGRLPFPGIVDLVASVLDAVPVRRAESLRTVLDADREAREAARERLGARTP